MWMGFQSTPSAWRETGVIPVHQCRIGISIHSLRMEGDLKLQCASWHIGIISIHSLRMEGDKIKRYLVTVRRIFQSTPSAWRETPARVVSNPKTSFQSTPSAWRETRYFYSLRPHQGHFNPLPPHGGRLLQEGVKEMSVNNFNPLPPHGGRLPKSKAFVVLPLISIHSLRMEGDAMCCRTLDTPEAFQSTPSAWRETY